MSTILEVQNLSKHFPIYGGILKRQVGKVHAVTGANFSVKKGETLGIVGESGCGKSTLGRTIVRLYEPTEGKIFFAGKDFSSFSPQELKESRKDMQMVFQDPYASLNPRMSIRKILTEPFELHNIGTPKEREEKVAELLRTVGLRPELMHRYPHEFSGGQRQRIGIARAIALRPKIVICDEAVSALDVSIQSQVLNLLVKLQKELDLTYLFISHDLSVVKYISDRIVVMYLGKIVEIASSSDLFKSPLHPYTQALLSAVPLPDPRRQLPKEPLSGDVPSPANPPSGCYFHTRCPMAKEECKRIAPELKPATGHKDHQVACLLVSTTG